MRSILIASGLLMLACSSNADGLAVPARTESGSRLRWSRREVLLELSPERGKVGLDGMVVETLNKAVAVWNAALSSCHAPRLVVSPAPLSRAAIREDQVNEILYHRRDWCPPGAMDIEECYDRTLHASTHLRPIRRPGDASYGTLKEADMEINGANFKWSARGAESGTFSLEVLLVHELGHVLGLNHPCAPVGSAEWKSGTVKVDCGDERVQRAVMHPHAVELFADRPARPPRAGGVCPPARPQPLLRLHRRAAAPGPRSRRPPARRRP